MKLRIFIWSIFFGSISLISLIGIAASIILTSHSRKSGPFWNLIQGGFIGSYNKEYMAGLNAEERNHPDLALPHFKKMIALRPDNPEGYLMAADIYEQRRQYDKAISTINRAFIFLHTDSQKSRVQAAVGKAYFLSGQYKNAKDHFTQAIQLAADRDDRENIPPPKGLLGVMDPDADKFSRFMFGVDGWLLEDYQYRSECYLITGKYKEGLEDLQHAITLDPHGKLMEYADSHISYYVDMEMKIHPHDPYLLRAQEALNNRSVK